MDIDKLYPHRMAERLCEQIIGDWVHDTISDFVYSELADLGVVMSDLTDDEYKTLIDRVYKFAMGATVTVQE